MNLSSLRAGLVSLFSLVALAAGAGCVDLKPDEEEFLGEYHYVSECSGEFLGMFSLVLRESTSEEADKEGLPRFVYEALLCGDSSRADLCDAVKGGFTVETFGDKELRLLDPDKPEGIPRLELYNLQLTSKEDLKMTRYRGSSKAGVLVRSKNVTRCESFKG